MSRRITPRIEKWIDEALEASLRPGEDVWWDCTVGVGSQGPEMYVVFFSPGAGPVALVQAAMVIPGVVRATRYDVEGTVEQALLRIREERSGEFPRSALPTPG